MQKQHACVIGGVILQPAGELVALAQAHALDATIFPYPSLPPVLGAHGAPRVWIARCEHDGHVVGFVGTRKRDITLDICGLAVAPSHRRLGVGRELLCAVIDSARTREFARVTLHVSTNNAAAIALYVSEGFEKVRHIEAFYRFEDGGAAWSMVKRIR